MQLEAQQLREIVARHGAALGLYARQWCAYPEDAVQEALVELIQLNELPDNPLAWLFRAVRWRAINLARSEHRRAEHQRRCSAERPIWFKESEDAGLQAREAEEMLLQLESVDREIVIARIWGELSLEQIADLVELSSSTVHRRYRRALEQLNALMHGENQQVKSHE